MTRPAADANDVDIVYDMIVDRPRSRAALIDALSRQTSTTDSVGVARLAGVVDACVKALVQASRARVWGLGAGRTVIMSTAVHMASCGALSVAARPEKRRRRALARADKAAAAVTSAKRKLARDNLRLAPH